MATVAAAIVVAAATSTAVAAVWGRAPVDSLAYIFFSAFLVFFSRCAWPKV